MRGKADVAREVVYSPALAGRLAEVSGLDAALVLDVVLRLKAMIDERWWKENHG